MSACENYYRSEIDWPRIRAIWETSEKWGAQWIIDAYGFPVSAKEIRAKYKEEGWQKRFSRRSRYLTPDDEMAKRKKLDEEPDEFNTAPAEEETESSTKYNQKVHDDLAFRFALLGATMGDVADALGVSEGTIARWRDKYPSFKENLYRGRMVADANVAHALYQRAIGMNIIETKVHVVNNDVIETPVVKMIPPDIAAAKFWLINRNPHEWKERVEVQENVNMQIGPTDEELDELYDRALKKRMEQRKFVEGRAERMKMIGVNYEDAEEVNPAE